MRVFTVVLVGLSLFGSAFATQAAVYVAADKSPETRLCVSAAMDPEIRFVLKMQDSGLSRNLIANRIHCNGMNITAFAKEAGNSKNFQRLRRYHRGFVEISDIARADVVTPTDVVTEIRGSHIAR